MSSERERLALGSLVYDVTGDAENPEDTGTIYSTQEGGYGVIWTGDVTPKFAAFEEVALLAASEDTSPVGSVALPFPEPADRLVTVTVTHAGQTQDFHGLLDPEVHSALSVGNALGGWTHLRDRGTSAKRKWVRIQHATAEPFRPTIPFVGRDWGFGMFGLNICLTPLDPETIITVEPITNAGRAWLRSVETPSEKRDRLLARFAEFDREAAEELDVLITELVADSREDGIIEARAEDD